MRGFVGSQAGIQGLTGAVGYEGGLVPTVKVQLWTLALGVGLLESLVNG